MFIETVRIQSLSNNSYVVGSEQSGQCAVIDPARDIDQYTNIASNHGVRIVYALETHLHNDFISGARELAAQTGCQVGSSASGGLLYPSVRLQDDDTFDLGEFQLRILHTPGHTPESISFMVEEQGEIRAVFTGGALLLGGVPRMASLTPLSARSQLDDTSILVDARPQNIFNEEHVPGSFAVPFGDNFSTWVGWIVPWGQPVILLSPDPSHHDAMVRQLIRIGYDRLNGYLAGGMDAWKTSGLPVEATAGIDVDTLKELWGQSPGPMILDVRQRNEYHAGHIQGALNIELGELQEHLDGLPREIPVVTVCASGMRASVAGSILQRDGRENVQVLGVGGTKDWLDLGYPIATGDE
jgi:hydroxyacylglutathione hydrolase